MNIARKTLALDIGGVCIRLRPQRVFETLGFPEDTPLPPDALKLIDDYNCGRADNAQFCDGLRAVTQRPFSDEQLQAAWNLFLDAEIPTTTQFLRKLWNRGWHIVWFSDTQPWHLDCLRKYVSYAKEIPEGIYSFEVGAQKPSPLMYEAFEQRFGKPDLYLDDRLDNIQGALARGWNAVQYRETEELPALCQRLLQ